MKARVCHLTSVHQPFDARIFHKECASLRDAGYQVSIVAPHDHDEEVDGIQVISVPKPSSRIERYRVTRAQVLAAGLAQDAELYHFHDPELIPIGLRLKGLGKRVVYDVHEDYPSSVVTKKWIPAALREIAAAWVRRMEQGAAGRFDALVCATPDIDSKFPHANTVLVQNFALLREPMPRDATTNRVAYVGSISRTRSAIEMMYAMTLIPAELAAELLLVGAYSDETLGAELAASPGWTHTHYQGYVQPKEIPALLATAKIGLALLHPVERYRTSQPVKFYEYMSAGLPIIASDFPYWRAHLKGVACAIWTDPQDPAAIANAIRELLEDPVMAERMGAEGRLAVERKFNWGREEQKLLQLYDALV